MYHRSVRRNTTPRTRVCWVLRFLECGRLTATFSFCFRTARCGMTGCVIYLKMMKRRKTTSTSTSAAGTAGAGTIVPLPLLTSSQLDLPQHARPTAASPRPSLLSTLVDTTLTRPLRYVSAIVRDPLGSARDACSTARRRRARRRAPYEGDGYASKRKLVGGSAASSTASLAMSAHGVELEAVQVQSEPLSPSQSPSHALPPPVHVSPLHRGRGMSGRGGFVS